MDIRIKALSNKEVSLKEGETTYGRNDLPNNDKRCSKKQLVLTRKSNSLYATRKGKNPSRLLRGDEDIILGKIVLRFFSLFSLYFLESSLSYCLEVILIYLF